MRPALLFAAISGFLTVAIGAFASHVLRGVVGPTEFGWIEIGLRGQAWHTLVLILVALLMAARPSRLLPWAAFAFAIGILLFSGGLYSRALLGHGFWTMVTPAGGLCLLAGWLLMIAYAVTLPPRG